MRIDKMNGGNSSFGNGRKRSQRLLLLALALGMAMVSVVLLHKLREGRMFGLMLQDQDRQISTLHLILQRDRENFKEMKRKLENLKAKNFLLRTQKIELSNKLAATQTAAYQLQNEMEATLEEKQNQIKGLADKEEESMRANLRVTEITELLKQREAEVEEMKQLEKLHTPVNNTIPQDGTKDNPTNSSKGRDAGEVKSEESEDTPKEGKWVKVQTNIDDEPLKDGGGEASDDHQNDNPTTSQENENKLEVEVKEQSEELKNGEGQIDNKEKKEQRADKAGETEISQESTTEVKEQNTEPINDQETSDNQEKKDAVVAKGGEENSQSGNENQVPKDLTIGKDGKGHKVRRNKNRGKSRRRRKATTNIREDNRYATKENNKGDGENQESARDTTNHEIPEGSQIDGSLNSEGQSKSEATEETREEKTATSDQQLENAQNQGDGEGSSEVHGDSINRTAEGDEKKITSTKEQSEQAENPHVDEARNENSDNKTQAAPNLATKKQDGVVNEEADVTTTSVPQQTDADNAAVEDEGTKVQERDSSDNNVESEEKEIASKEKQSGKSENLQEDEAKSENNNNETGASAEANSNTENQRNAGKQDAVVKEETDVNTPSIAEQQGDVNIESVTEKPDTDNAADDQQTRVSEITANTDDGSSVYETGDEEDTA